MGDPITDGLNKAGIPVEPREASAVEQMVASGVGGIAGSALAAMAGFGWLGKAVASLGGAVLGHVVVTHRLKCDDKASGSPRADGIEPSEPR